MKNRMSDVRDHLVATLEALQDAEKPMDIARAKAVSDVAQTYINAVKVEVDARKLMGSKELPAAIEQSTAAPVPALPEPRRLARA